MDFRKAERYKARLRLCITGPAGSGKTYGALLIAQGLGGKTVLIDTENGSGDLYADSFDYDIGTIKAPYDIQKYFTAIHDAEQAGYEIIIIDSLSHAWAGEGGLLDMQAKIADNSRNINSWAAWRKITPWHNKLVDVILSSPCHIIATMRSKTEYIQAENDKGKTEIRKVGLAPVQREGIDYEFTTVFDLNINHMATVSKDRTSIFDGDIFTISQETGEKLKTWLESGIDLEQRHQQQKELWGRYLAVFNDDAKQAKEAMLTVTGKQSFDNCSTENIKALFEDIENREKNLFNSENYSS